jgi:hypothetical protein
VERTGRSLTTGSGRLLQDGSLRALALAAFATERRGLEFADASMPEVPPPESCPALEKRIEIHDRYEQGAIAPLFSGGEHALAAADPLSRARPPTRWRSAFTDVPAAVFSDGFCAHRRQRLTSYPSARAPGAEPGPTPGAAVFRRVAGGGFVEEDGDPPRR